MKALRYAITICLALTVVPIGVLMGMMGILGLAGRLADTSYAENIKVGLLFLVIAAVLLVPFAFWLRWASFDELPSRFSLRSLLVVMTIVAVLSFAVGAVLRM